jgi:MscS family membrane protein
MGLCGKPEKRMESLISQYSGFFLIVKDWVMGLSMLPLAFIFNATFHSFLRRSKRWRLRGKTLRKIEILWPSVSSLIYVIGIQFFGELAPIRERTYLWLSNGCFVFSVCIGLNILRHLALFGVQWASQRARHYETFDAGFVPLLQNITTLFVSLTGAIIVLKHFGYDVMSLITALGVGSLAVGLAAKDTLSNMIAGFILIMDRNLRPGDRIELSGTLGDVRVIGLRSTQLLTVDGNTLIVPNSDLVNNRILNLSVPSREVSTKMEFRIPKEIRLEQIRDLCEEVVQSLEHVAADRPFRVHLQHLAEGHQLILVTLWVKDYLELGPTTSEFQNRMLTLCQKQNIPLLSRPVCS